MQRSWGLAAAVRAFGLAATALATFGGAADAETWTQWRAGQLVVESPSSMRIPEVDTHPWPPFNASGPNWTGALTDSPARPDIGLTVTLWWSPDAVGTGSTSEQLAEAPATLGGFEAVRTEWRDKGMNWRGVDIVVAAAVNGKPFVFSCHMPSARWKQSVALCDRIAASVQFALAPATPPVATVKPPPPVAAVQPVTPPPPKADAGNGELEKLKLQAEIERLKLEQIRTAQGAKPNAVAGVEATQPGPDKAKPVAPMGRRVALVIGNSDYAQATKLPTPANDARQLAARLQRLGFEVIVGVDRSRSAMAGLLGDYYAKAEGADVALFYYSGHGLQVEGRNFLVPIDAEFADRSALFDIEGRALDLQKFLSAGARARINIALIDACRDNPLVEKKLASDMYKSIDGAGPTKGLAVVKREQLARGQFVGFAAEPGKTAETGTGDTSVYTAALLKGLDEPGVDISILYRKVRTDVEAATNGRQSPRYADDLTEAFMLNPGNK